MAGKRNVSRLRKALNKNNTSDNLKKAAQSVERAARSAAASASVSRGANAIRRTGQSTGSRYAGSGSSGGNYVRNSRLQSNRRQEDKKKERKQTTTKAVMERYQNRTISQGRNNKSAAAKAQYRQNDNALTKKQKQTLKKNKARYDKGLGGISEGVAKRYGGSLISGAADTVEDVTNYLSRSMPALKTGTSAAKALYDNTVGRADERLSTQNVKKKLEKTGGKLQKSGQKNIDKAKEGRSKAAQWGIDLGTAATEMGLDALLTRGRGTMGAMYTRSYGSAKQSALDEGASEEQARNYGRAIGGLEAATEKMFSVAKPLKSLFGKGVADDVTETLLNKVVSKASTQAGKNAAYHGGKTLTAAITEGLEEMVSEGLDPVIANTIYANAIGKPHSTSAGDVLYAGSVGAAMGGILGGGGQIVEYGQGRRVQNVFGDDGVKTLAKAAAQVDDAAEAAKGAALNEMINRGDGIAAGQANELYRAVYNQEIKDLERGNLAARSADAIMQRENLISPIQVNEETGETVVGRNTVQAFNEQKEVATAAVNQLVAETDLQLPEMSTEQISSAVAAIQTGIGGIDEVNLFTVGNPEARTVYEAVTGKTLPETNQETREMLFEEIGKNRVNSARLETEKTVDAVKGLVAQDMSQYYEAAGQEAFAQAFSDVNVGDAAQVGESLETFDDFYRAGRNGIVYADVVSAANPAHESVPSDIKRAAWQAGQQDAFLAADTARGLQMRIGETARRARSQRRSGGRLYSDISKENRSRFAASQQSMYRMLARTFGIDIHVVDSLESGANGEYHDGVIYLSMSSDRALEYVFAHEITHHMQDYAPEEYNQLKELVRTRWAQQGGIDDAVNTKMAQYARHDAKLTREQALDEIIADSTYEMLQDEEFIDEVSKTHRNIAQALLDAIKEVLKKLRLMIAGGDRFTPAQNEALLSELDILKEFEKMWTDGLMRAAENRAAVGSVGTEARQQARQRVQPFDITRSEILQNMKTVTDMSPVVTLDGSGFEKQEGRPLSQAVMDYYGGKEFYVNNSTLGEVKVGKRGIKSGVQHKLYGSKIDGFKGLREVISNGKIINVTENYSGNENDRVMIAAPIMIGDEEYYMGVVVNRNLPKNVQNYYLHDVIWVEKNSLATKDTGTPKGSERIGKSVSPYTILQQLNNINSLSENDVISDEGRFSLKDTVEETKDLIAQHNLGADNLKKAFGLGGFPMPSIAITKGTVGHTNFGEISLIFDKATIDPADSRNKVYGADAWTPTFPDIEYEINDKKASKIYAKANEAGHVPFLNPTDFHPSNMESRISNKGEQGLIEHYKDDYGLKQMYLVDIGETPVDYVQTTVREEMSDRERREGQWYLDNEPELCESFAKVRVDENPMKWRKDNIEKLREAYKNYLVSEGLAEDAADEVANAAKAYEVSKPLLNAEKIKNGKDVIERTENDFTATKEVIDKKINEEDYEKWFSELFSGIEKNSGVWNGKDPYMPSGNRRSFAATHYPVTLDNIVSAMLAQADDIRNSESMFVGTKTIRAAATESFGSIKGIKEASKKIKKIDTDEYNALRENLDSRLSAVINEIAEANVTDGNIFMAMDSIGLAIEEACSEPTVENIKEKLKSYKWEVTDAQAQEINDIINEVVDMPVSMFEAKPLRAVGFDEVRAAVVPDDIDADIKSGLSDRGVEVFEYENDNNADRIAKVNAAAEKNNVKFSLPDEADVIDYANEHETEFVDVPPVRDYEKDAVRVKQQTYGELLEQVEKLRRDKRLTKGRVLDERSVREEVNNLISTLMTYSESYTLNGGRRKTNHELVRDGVHAAGQIFTALKKGDVYEAITTAELAAEDIVERLEIVNDEMFYEYKELRDYLRTTRIVISDEDAANIPDFKDFKTQQAGRLRIVKQNGIPVDTVYAELSEKWPEFFSGELKHPADQLLEMADVRESLEPYDVMLSAEETQQLIKQTAQDLLDIAVRGKAFKSWADKKAEQYDERLRLVKARQKEAVRDVRRNVRERAERILQRERQKWAERVNRANERADRRVQEEKDKARAREERRKDTQARREYIASIESNRKWLADRILKPTDDKHIPEGFRAAVADLLSQMDMQTIRSKKLEAKRGERARRWVEMDELRSRLAEIAKEDGSGEFEYDGYIFEVIDSMAQHMDGKAIDEASTEQLHEFDILMKYIVTNIRNYDKMVASDVKETVSQLGRSTIAAANTKIANRKRHGGIKKERGGAVGDILNSSNLTPIDVFERIGGGMGVAYKELRHGFDKHVDNITEFRAFYEELFKPYNRKGKPGSKIERWRTDKDAVTKELSSGQKVTMSRAQIMSLYCLLKREQAVGHIMNGGITMTEIETAKRLKGALSGKEPVSSAAIHITYEEAQELVSELTDEQRDMADKLQGYLNGRCAELGNEASMKMFGYRKFTEKNYFPIKSADNWITTDAETRTPVETIKNFGFTKGTVVNANNPIVIDDIFKVVADHMNKMSLYNSLAPAIRDFMKVYNYKDDVAGGDSVKGKIDDAWGKRYNTYIRRFLADLQSNAQMKTEGLGRFISKSLANYKKAAIGFNLRVAVQQPTAIVRAMTLINPVYFAMKNHVPMPLQKLRKDTGSDYKDMLEHCQVARWKSWGFTQVDMARDLDSIMMNEEWSRSDVLTMQIYGALDNYTWAKIWGAVRAETKAKHKDVEVNSEEFYRLCNERASEVFDKTQVVDSVFHRSQAMRNTDALSKMLTSFMAEPTRTYNLMKSQYGDAVELWQNEHKARAVGKVMRASNIFVFNAAAVSAVAAVVDAFLRGKDVDDDDEPDGWWENFLNNFWGNVNPINMVPILKDIWSYKDGWGSQNMAMEGYADMMEDAQAIWEKINGDSDASWSELFKNFAGSLGYVTGVPVKNIMREWESICDIFGINVFAAEEGSEEKTADKESILDKAADWANIKDGSWIDNLLNGAGVNLTEEEKEKAEYKEKLASVQEKIDGLSDEEKQEKIWDEVTENYTTYIKDGDINKLREMRRQLQDLDGDVETFDERVLSEVKTAFKKNIGAEGDPEKLEKYRIFMIERGMTTTEISQDIVAKSDTTKEFQVALCLNDEETAVNALSSLKEAGISYQDAYTLFVNRTKAIKGADYSTGELAYPTDGTITSAFGYRNSPTAGASSYHEGIDIGAPLGSDVAAADGGKVSRAGRNGGKGYSVTIDHGNGRYTEYNHLNCYYVQKGDAVSKGQIIAAVGSTGVSTGPHLDFRVRESGTYVDPMIYFK